MANTTTSVYEIDSIVTGLTETVGPVELSVQLKFTLRINVFVCTTVVTAFTYGTHVG